MSSKPKKKKAYPSDCIWVWRSSSFEMKTARVPGPMYVQSIEVPTGEVTLHIPHVAKDSAELEANIKMVLESNKMYRTMVLMLKYYDLPKELKNIIGKHVDYIEKGELK